jgi:hypothetical protein
VGMTKENREVASLNLSGPLSDSISVFVGDVPSDSVMAGPVVFEEVDTDHVAASPDQAVEGDVSNILGHGAPNSSPTSEPQAKGVDLPKAGLTVAASAIIPPQGTIPRNPTSSQPLLMWNEEERRPPDSSGVSGSLPRQHDQFRETSLMDQGMLGQFPESSIPHTPEPALVDLDFFSGMGVDLQQSRMVTTETGQLTIPSKGTTGVTQEGVWYPATVLAALPPHSGMLHSSEIGPRHMSWLPYGGLPTFETQNLSSEVQPPRASSSGASDVERKEGLDNEPQRGRVCGEEGHPHYIPSLMDDDRMRDHFHESPIPPTPALPPHSGTQQSTGTGLRQQMTWSPSGGFATFGRSNLSSEMQLQGAGSAGAPNVEKKAGLENGPKEGHQLRETHYLRSPKDEWMSGQFPQSSTTPTAEPAPAVSSQYAAKPTSKLIDLDFLTELGVGLPESRVAATAPFQPTSPMKGTTGVNQEGIWYPAEGSVALPTHSGTQHSTGTDTWAMTWPVYEGLGTSGRTKLSSEVQPRGAGSAHASNVEKKGGQENWLFDVTQHTHMGQMTRSPYGGLPTSGRTKLLSEVQTQPPRADFASGSNVEKKGGLVDDGQRQLQNPSRYNPPLHSGLSGADSNLVDAMGQNTTPNPTFKPPQAQKALQQDKPMPQYAELMAKEEERKESTV